MATTDHFERNTFLTDNNSVELIYGILILRFRYHMKVKENDQRSEWKTSFVLMA